MAQVARAGARIGDRFTAHSHAVVREYCQIGNRVILQNGVVVGGDGFGFAKRADLTHHKIAQSGVTIVGDDVEIQTLTSVDRATFGETRVRRGAKIDSLVQIGHNVTVGRHCIIVSQTGISGSVIVEDYAMLGGQVRISDHVTIGERCVIGAGSLLVADAEPEGVYSAPAAERSRVPSSRLRNI